MYRNMSGFTLIELVLVILVTAILAAVAGAKFISLTTDANLATLDSIRAKIIAADNLVYSLARARGIADAQDETIDIDGQTVRLRFGHPKTNQMFFRNANNPGLVDLDIPNAEITGGNIVRLEGKNDCRIRYRRPTSATSGIRIDTRTTDC